MKILLFAAMAVVPAIALAKDVLPIKRGVYVVKGTPCESPAAANLIGYYGDYIAPGHDSCSFKAVRRSGRQVKALMECTDHQGGDKAPASYTSIFTIVNSENVVIGTQLGDAKSKFDYQLYTWCREKL